MGDADLVAAVNASENNNSNNNQAVKRAREFYRYLQPDNLVLPRLARRGSVLDIHDAGIPSLSTALAPFCQLTALRCDVRKAMLNVMDRDVMYFLAEASRVKTGEGAMEAYDFVDDPIMMACSSVPLEGRICEMTLAATKDAPGNVPMFTIPDLTKSAFSQLGPVAGPPYYRFYAGTPITTRQGINIGSLAVMDTEPRDGLTPSEVAFLGTTAGQIMTYLETNRQAIEGRRARRLAQGLDAFISGKRSIRDADLNGGAIHSMSRKKAKTYGIDASDHLGGPTRDLSYHAEQPQTGLLDRRNSMNSDESEFESSGTTTDAETQRGEDLDTESRSHNKTFARAANLLRESIGDLGEDGFVVFVSLKSRIDQPGRPPSQAQRHQPASRSQARRGSTSSSNVPTSSSPLAEAETIAASSFSVPYALPGKDLAQPVHLEDGFLKQLMQRYPGGKLWSFDDGRSSSSDEDNLHNRQFDPSDIPRRSSRGSKRRSQEYAGLSAAFPAARQILFAPIWDTSVGSFHNAIFVAASSDTRSLSAGTELSYVNSFCSTVMAECSRIDTVKADKQKR
jgi:hypothetical protein